MGCVGWWKSHGGIKMSNMTEPPEPHMSPLPPGNGEVNQTVVYAAFAVLLLFVVWFGFWVSLRFWRRRKK